MHTLHWGSAPPFGPALGAESPEQVVDLTDLEAGRIGDNRNVRMVQTEGPAARLAMEVAVHLVDAAGVVAVEEPNESTQKL